MCIQVPTFISHFYFFGFVLLSAAPIATPTAIHTGSFVAAKTATPIAVPTPIQVTALLEFLNFLFILSRNVCLLHSYGLVFDSSIPFIKFQNYSQVHFKKRSFVIVKNEIDSIDINFIKVVKTD